MRRSSRTIARLAVTAVLVVASLLASSTPAVACSVGPDFDRRAATAVFAIGRIVSVDLVAHPEQPSKSTANTTWYRKLVTLRADLVLKGPVATTIRFFDAGVAQRGTVSNTGQPYFSWGGGGDCGTITEDPTGKYAAFALARAEDGTLSANILFGAAFGRDASDPAIQELVRSHGLSLPSTSTR